MCHACKINKKLACAWHISLFSIVLLCLNYFLQYICKRTKHILILQFFWQNRTFQELIVIDWMYYFGSMLKFLNFAPYKPHTDEVIIGQMLVSANEKSHFELREYCSIRNVVMFLGKCDTSLKLVRKDRLFHRHQNIPALTNLLFDKAWYQQNTLKIVPLWRWKSILPHQRIRGATPRLLFLRSLSSLQRWW